MTAARRAAPEPPTALQRLARRLTSGQHHEALVSAIEDHADRLDARARRADAIGWPAIGNDRRQLAAELRALIRKADQ